MIISYLFLHNEWTDMCFLNTDELKINQKNKYDESGTYKMENDKIIIKWNNWNNENTFIKYDDYYYDIFFYNKYIKD